VSRIGLARFTGEAGNSGAARDLFAALVPDCERILGPDHAETLTARASLAYWTGQARTSRHCDSASPATDDP